MRFISYSLFSVCYAILLRVCSGDIKILYTIGYSYSEYFSLKENLTPDGFLRFSVRAPRDAHILLAPTHDADEPVYEIVLGAQNNSVNHIRGRCPCQQEPSATIRTVDLLSPTKFRNFWVRVKSERSKTFVQVGLGDSNTAFHEWRDPRPLTPQYLSFRSATKAEWHYGYKDSTYNNGVSRDRRQIVVTSTGFGQYHSLADVVNHSEDGVTLYFTVRTKTELQVLLTPEVSSLGDVYFVCIYKDGAHLKKRVEGDIKAAFQQSKFFNETERLRFWIKFSIDGVIMLGKDSSLSPLLQWRDPYPLSPQYLSFTLNRNADEDYDPTVFADVQYGLGPDYTLSSQDCTLFSMHINIKEDLTLGSWHGAELAFVASMQRNGEKSAVSCPEMIAFCNKYMSGVDVTDQVAARWKLSTNQLPAGAVRGGRYNEDELFVCRAKHESDTMPGNYIVDVDKRGGCYISHNFSVHQKSEFEVLTGCNLKWVSASLGHVPEGSIVGGYRKGRPKYYIIRVKHEGVLIIGKLKPEDRIAYVPYNGQELPFTNYEALVQSIKVDTTSVIAGTRASSPFFERTTQNVSLDDIAQL